jgi:two-component system, sensor histidine kinase and response regulator
MIAACKALLIVVFVFSLSVLNAQSRKAIDSLYKKLNETENKQKADIYLKICWELRDIDPKTGAQAGELGIQLAKELAQFSILAELYNRVGVNYRNQGNYSQALNQYFESLAICEKHLLDSILPYCYNNIGEIYNRLELYPKALDYTYKALDIFIKFQNKIGIAYAQNQIGTIYSNQTNWDEALKNYHNALKLRTEQGNEKGIAACYQNIAFVLLKMEKHTEAFDFYTKGIIIFEKLNVESGITNCLNGLGEYYFATGDLKNAEKNFTKALQLSKKINSPVFENNALNGLQKTYRKMNNFSEAYRYLLLERSINDSLKNISFVKKITQMEMDYNFNLRQKQMEEKQKLKELASAEKIKEQRKFTIALILAFLTSMLAVLILWINYKLKNKANIALTAKNKEIELINQNITRAHKEISEQKEKLASQAEEILAQRDELSNQNITKDKFISIIAHDLRNPMHAMLGLSEIMVNDSKNIRPEKVELYSKAIFETAETTYALLENLLEWAQLQGGKIVFSPEKISLNEITKSVLELVKVMAHKKNIEIRNELTENIKVYADKNMISTVIRNLVTNAIKFTPTNGQVTLKTLISDIFPGLIRVSVVDTGIGIKKEDLPKLFRVDVKNSEIGTTHEGKGTGLGLVMCKEFVEKNGGTIWVESSPGSGSTFSFTLPLAEK